MKTSKFLIAGLVGFFFLTTFTSNAFAAERPYLALLTPAQTHVLLQEKLASNALTTKITPDQQTVLDAGKRVYDWIILLNKNLPAGQKPYSYSTAANTSNPTMDHPKIYDATTGVKQYAALVAKMPADYKTIVTGQGALPVASPIPMDQFLEIGYAVANAYDITARWIMMEEWLPDLQKGQVRDMRGYVRLSAMPDREAKFASFDTLPADQQAELKTDLVEMCLNGQSEDSYDRATCVKSVDQSARNGKLSDFYSAALPTSKALYASFFELEPSFVRSDIVWTSADPQTIHYPFLAIADQSVADYLKLNVEDEWRTPNAHLSIDFTNSTRANLSHLDYQPNTTPHADVDKIVMDENEPRSEYIAQWTIRHEFGHLLGFKDCYVEFYDDQQKQMVNYPLDPTNLMCARRGHLQPQHFDVLKATYYKP